MLQSRPSHKIFSSRLQWRILNLGQELLGTEQGDQFTRVAKIKTNHFENRAYYVLVKTMGAGCTNLDFGAP